MQTLYDVWDEERFPEFEKRLKELYDVSLNYFESRNQDSPTKEEDLRVLNHLFQLVEQYFVAFLKLGYATKVSFPLILEQMKKIRFISILEPSLRPRLNGLTYKNMIAMNPTPGCYPGMDVESTLILAFYHELGHIITGGNIEDTKYLQKFLDSGDHEAMIEKGFALLDEVAVENIAEDVYYDQKGEARPEVKPFHNPIIYPKGEFHSNFAFYHELQEMACQFAKCFEFLHLPENASMDEVLKRLGKSMVSKEFCFHFFHECMLDPEKKKDFETMLINMGKVKDAKYSTFGIGKVKREDLDVTNAIVEFQVLSEKHKFVPVKEEEKVQS